MIKEDEITAVGKLLKTHALKGELNVLLDIDPGYLEEDNPAILDIDGIYVPFYADSIRPKGSMSFLVKFEGIDSEIEARSLVNKTVYALRERLKDFMLDNYDEEYALYDDLIGWTIEDSETGPVGKIVDIDTNTENELFIVESPAGNTIFIPLTEDFIEKLDEDSKTILMHLPQGLIDLN